MVLRRRGGSAAQYFGERDHVLHRVAARADLAKALKRKARTVSS